MIFIQCVIKEVPDESGPHRPVFVSSTPGIFFPSAGSVSGRDGEKGEGKSHDQETSWMVFEDGRGLTNSKVSFGLSSENPRNSDFYGTGKMFKVHWFVILH